MKKNWSNGRSLFVLFVLLISFYGFRPAPLFHLAISIDTHLTIEADGRVKTVELLRLPQVKKGETFEFSLLHLPSHVSKLQIVQKQPVEVEFVPFSPLQDKASEVPSYRMDTENNRIDLSLTLEPSRQEVWIEVSYLLQGSLINHFDTSQLFFRCIQFNEKTFLAHWNVEATLAETSEAVEILSWIRGPNKASLSIFSGTELLQTAQAQAFDFPPYVQLLVPIIMVPANQSKSLEFSLSSIIQGEQLMDARINETVRKRKTLWLWAQISLGLSILYLLLSWCKNTHCFHQSHNDKQIIKEAPEFLRPAELGLMIHNGRVNIRDMLATFFDLAIRGYIQIEEYILFVKDGGKKSHALDYRIVSQEKSNDLLSSYELVFLQTMFQEFSQDKKTISFYEIRKIFSRTPKLFERFWKKWLKALRKRAIVLNFFDHRVTRRQTWLRIAGILLAIASASCSFALLAFFTDYIDLIPLTTSFTISGILMFLVSFFFKRRSDISEKNHARYNAYRNYLTNFKNIDWNTIEKALPWVLIWEMEKSFFLLLKKTDQRKTESDKIFAASFYRSSLSEDIHQQIVPNMESMVMSSFHVFSAGLRTVRKAESKG